MKGFFSATKRFFEEIWADAMLAVLVFVPVLMGLAFHFGVPGLEGYLCSTLGKAAVLRSWYPVFDLLLSIMTPVMFTAAGALVILDEADSGLSRAIAVTPVGRVGYLASRIVVPAVIATVYCFFATVVFRISTISVGRLALLALCSGAQGVVTALMISALADNKVEGLAYSKFSGLFVLGLPASVLVASPLRYLAGILPTFWMTELAMGSGIWAVLPALATAAVWVWILSRRFFSKVLA